NGDTPATFNVSPNVPTTVATVPASSPTGSYPITVGRAIDSDYTIRYVNGTLTVTPPSLAAYTLNQSASDAVTAPGNAIVKLPGGLYVDSSSASAITASGNAQVNVGGTVLVVGGVSKSGNASVTKTGTLTATSDPLASLPLPGLAGLTNFGAVSVA